MNISTVDLGRADRVEEQRETRKTEAKEEFKRQAADLQEPPKPDWFKEKLRALKQAEVPNDQISKLFKEVDEKFPGSAPDNLQDIAPETTKTTSASETQSSNAESGKKDSEQGQKNTDGSSSYTHEAYQKLASGTLPRSTPTSQQTTIPPTPTPTSSEPVPQKGEGLSEGPLTEKETLSNGTTRSTSTTGKKPVVTTASTTSAPVAEGETLQPKEVKSGDVKVFCENEAPKPGEATPEAKKFNLESAAKFRLMSSGGAPSTPAPVPTPKGSGDTFVSKLRDSHRTSSDSKDGDKEGKGEISGDHGRALALGYRRQFRDMAC